MAHVRLWLIFTISVASIRKPGFCAISKPWKPVFIFRTSPAGTIIHLSLLFRGEGYNIVENKTSYGLCCLSFSGGRICSFSPCIEQVQRTCECLDELEFGEIETLECLTRAFDVRSVNMSLPDLGFGPGKYPEFDDVGGTVHQPVIGQIVEGSAVENERQIAQNNESSENSDKEEDCGKGKKRKKQNSVQEALKQKKGKPSIPTEPSFAFKSGLSPLQMPGHTGYLTFATLYPQE